MVENDPTKLPALTQRNYQTWSKRMEGHLRELDCLEAVEEPQGVETDPRKNELAFNVLVKALEKKDNGFVVGAKNSARALWEILAQNYKRVGTERAAELVAVWSSMELKLGESITDYYYRFVVLLKHLKAANVNTDDGMNKIMYLKGLPDTFAAQRVMYYSDLSLFSLQQINTGIMAQEKKCSESSPSGSEFLKGPPDTRGEPREMDYSDLSLGSLEQINAGIMAQEKWLRESSPSRSEFLKGMPDAGGEQKEMVQGDLRLGSREQVNTGIMTQEKKVGESSPSRSEFLEGLRDTCSEQRQMVQSDLRLASREQVNTGIMTQEENVVESSPSRSEFLKGLPDTRSEQRAMDQGDLRLGSLRALRHVQEASTGIMTPEKKIGESSPPRSEFLEGPPGTRSEQREMYQGDVRLGSLRSLRHIQEVNTGITTQEEKVSESSPSRSEFRKGLLDTRSEQREMSRSDVRLESLDQVNTRMLPQEKRRRESSPSRHNFPKHASATKVTAGCGAEGAEWKSDNPVRQYPCTYPGCGQAFCSRHYLKSHQGVHSEVGAFRCPVPGCNRTFELKQHFTRHTNLVHSKRRRKGREKCEDSGK